jgi:acetyl-CoA carboxylase biotin carboxylase subunit
MNTRLQVEHPVTEDVTGVDLVKEQLRIAQGEKLTLRQEDVTPRGHAIECRIYAEDPFRSFAPSPGLIRYLNLPSGPGIRNDNGVYTGYTVPIFYDPMLSKLIAWGATRTEAIERMKRALAEYRVDGIETTIPFYSLLISHPDFESASFDTGYIDRFLANMEIDRSASESQIEAAIMAAAILLFEETQNVQLPSEDDSTWRRAGRIEGVSGGRL